jgi:hypothetical protein
VNDPLHYDLTINTERLLPADAADLVFRALERRGFDLARLTLPPAADAAG